MTRSRPLLGVMCVTLAACGGHHRVAPQACAAGQLRTTVGHTVVAAGTSGGYVTFTNVAPDACTLKGWPTVVGLTADGRATRAHRIRNTEFGPELSRPPVVTLAPGARADAVFDASDASTTARGTCPPSYRRLRVTPPGDGHSAVISGWIASLDAYLPACSGIRVTFVVPSARLYKG